MKAYIRWLRHRNRILLLPICLVALGFYTFPTVAHAVACGPHMLTYAVHRFDGAPVAGFRCVKVSVHSPDGSSAEFDWYGEGDRGDGSYRHIGTGYTTRGEFGSLARAADLFGNGETFKGLAMNLIPAVTAGTWPAPEEVRISGDWNEIWRLVTTDIKYTPLPRPTVCGPHFTHYNVRDLAGRRPGSGVRCVVNLGFAAGFYLWFGTGEWEGTRYSHIGHFNLPSRTSPGTGQATDLCDPHFGSACNDFPAASLTFTPVPGDLQVTGAWSEWWISPGISVFSLNPSVPVELIDLSTGQTIGPNWRVRSKRVAAWMAANAVTPDIIALQQIGGWWWRLFSPDNWGDYDTIDQLLADFRDVTGVTYRVAYLTAAPPDQVTVAPTTWTYTGHALLYNPARLINRTALESPPVAHDAENIRGPHLRRSLPLCNRGTTLMPLASLIDGPPQTDKCGRETPSGPSLVIIPEGQHHIVASFNRFAPVWDQSRTIGVFNVNPEAGFEHPSARLINRLVSELEPPPYGGASLYYPPLMVGDFNSINEGEFPGFKKVFWDGDVDLLLIGQEESFPSQCVVHDPPSRSLVIPSLPDGVKCPGPPNMAVSDHCGLFVQLELDACGFRRVFIDGPFSVDAREWYRLTAVPAGGGPDWAYRWQPGGATTPHLDATAGDPISEQTWTVVVTDLRTGKTMSGSRRVVVRSAPVSCSHGTLCHLNAQCCEPGEPSEIGCCLLCVPRTAECP